MKKGNFILLYVLALSLSLFGFYIDGDARAPSLWTNITDITMMSFVLFGILCLLYLSAGVTWRLVRAAFKRADN